MCHNGSVAACFTPQLGGDRRGSVCLTCGLLSGTLQSPHQKFAIPEASRHLCLMLRPFPSSPGLMVMMTSEITRHPTHLGTHTQVLSGESFASMKYLMVCITSGTNPKSVSDSIPKQRKKVSDVRKEWEGRFLHFQVSFASHIHIPLAGGVCNAPVCHAAAKGHLSHLFILFDQKIN